MGPAPTVADTRRAVRECIADLPAGALVLVACSGGADSLALASAVAFEAPRAGLRAGAVTIDHGLQAGSRERAAAVVEACRGMNLAPVEAVAVDVGRDGGPEAAARTARYAALDAAAARHGAVAVLLAHTRDDQAETVLLGLARGSGARSLSGMAAVGGPGDSYRRPFLDLPRTTTRGACEALGLVPWDDPHNGDPSFARVRVRTTALPALEDTLGPGVAAALARSARLLRDDADALDQWAARERDGLTASDGGLDAGRLAALPAAVRRRVLLTAALRAGVPGGTLTASHLEAIDALVVRWHGQQGVDLPGRIVARRRCGTLYMDGGSVSGGERAQV